MPPLLLSLLIISRIPKGTVQADPVGVFAGGRGFAEVSLCGGFKSGGFVEFSQRWVVEAGGFKQVAAPADDL